MSDRMRLWKPVQGAIVDEPLAPDTEWALIDPSTGDAVVVIGPDTAARRRSR